MRLLQLVIGASFFAASAVAQVDSYISSEGPIAKTGLFANIGPDGSKDAGAGVRKFRTNTFRIDPDDQRCRRDW